MWVTFEAFLGLRENHDQYQIKTNYEFWDRWRHQLRGYTDPVYVYESPKWSLCRTNWKTLWMWCGRSEKVCISRQRRFNQQFLVISITLCLFVKIKCCHCCSQSINILHRWLWWLFVKIKCSWKLLELCRWRVSGISFFDSLWKWSLTSNCLCLCTSNCLRWTFLI